MYSLSFLFIVSRQALENAKVMHVCTDECFKIQDISIIPSDFLGKVLCRGFYTIQYAYFGSIVYWCKTLPFYIDRRNKIGQKLALSQLINSNWISTVAIVYNMHEMIWTECEKEAFV